MRVAVLGQGYVGLTAAVCLAESGHIVTGVEADPSRLALLRAGRSPLHEPGLQRLLSKHTQRSALTFERSLTPIGTPDAVMITVGSPGLPSGGADLRDLGAAIRHVLQLASLPDLIVVKSTVPPGTSRRLIRDEGAVLAGRYVYSPEFLSQGAALDGWRSPFRVVVGLEAEALLPKMRDLYEGITAPWVVTSPTDAEMIKYASNAFLATKISFINEIANLSDRVGARIDEVVKGLALDPRIGGAFLRAGAGYGGSCFPKDLQALAHLSSRDGHPMPLLEAVLATNSDQRYRLLRVVLDRLDRWPGASVAVLGLTYKPNTDDTREAPSLTVISELAAREYDVRVWDPAAPTGWPLGSHRRVRRFETIEEAAMGAAALVLLTEWPQIREADWNAVAESLVTPRLIVDGRNFLDPDEISRLGLDYWAFGRSAHGAVQQSLGPSGGGEREGWPAYDRA